MKFLIIIATASLASADKLDKVYLPPGARTSGGDNAGLQTPVGPSQEQNFRPQPNFGSAPAAASASASASATAEILKYENEITADGYHYAYETSDGTKAEQEGRNLPGAAPEEGSLQVTGSFSYIGDDGQTYSITYTADENGYHAEGAHLPTSPPIPEAILKSLQLTAGKGGNGIGESGEGQYSKQKSSYDADAGY